MVKFNEIGFTPVYYAILLKNIDGEKPLLFDLKDDQYYDDIDSYNIEIVENRALARMLYHNVEIDQEIPPELYQAVAEVLAYVYRLKNSAS